MNLFQFMSHTVRFSQWPVLAACLALAGCSSDPATFLSYSQTKTAAAGTFDATKTTQRTDALALNYANSVEEIFRARSTGSRYAREGSDTALAGLAAFTGAAKSLTLSTSTLTSMGLAGAGILQLRNIFDAKGRSTAYFEAAERIHSTIKDYGAHNLNDVSETELTPNGWTLVNVVQANIDIVDKILNGHLPTPQALIQASEPMTAEGALPQHPGTIPVNNLPAQPLVSTTANPPANARVQAAAALETTRTKKDAAELARLRAQLERLRAQTPDNHAFSAVILQIADIFPKSDTDPDEAAKLKLAYSTLLDDPVLKDASPKLPFIQPDGNDIVRVFQIKATTDDQRQRLMKAAENQLKRMKP